MLIRKILGLALLVGLIAAPAGAGALLQPVDAPDWQVSEWINGNPGKLSDHRGRVVLIEFFQLWCPGCNSFSIPLFERWNEMYGERDDVLVVSIHTVFEGHDMQTPAQLRRFVEDQGIDHPTGIDGYESGDQETPITMRRFETGGTPHVVIVDKNGQIRFSHFGSFDPLPTEAFIDRLLKETSEVTPPPKPKATADTGLSGKYQIRFEQLAKSCGRKLPPIETAAELTIQGSEITASFRRPFLGRRKISGTFDETTGRFEGTLDDSGTERGSPIHVLIDFSGQLAAGEPPRVSFQFSLEKDSPEPRRKCSVQGRGQGRRTAPL